MHARARARSVSATKITAAASSRIQRRTSSLLYHSGYLLCFSHLSRLPTCFISPTPPFWRSSLPASSCLVMTQKCAKLFSFFFLIFMCALWCGPINHIGVYPRLCRDELKLPHNSGEVGGGSRTLRIITSEAEGSEKRDSGCDAEMSFPRLN